MNRTVPVSQIHFDPQLWPRDELDEQRVGMFQDLLEEGEPLEPIEAVPQDDGTLLGADGVHRFAATVRAGQQEIDVAVIEPLSDESVRDCAYRRALETATKCALPLNRSQRRRAVQHLLETRPDLSRRSIARLVGVAHSTVDRWAVDAAPSASESVDEPTIDRLPTADQMARRLVGFLTRLDESRGLLDYMAPSRMGRHLADAFEDRLGDAAPTRARLLAKWTTAAAQVLEHRVMN